MKMAQWENTARADRLMVIARRAVNQGAGAMDLKPIDRALTAYWRILLEDPRRTLLTIAAASLLAVLPQALYRQLQALAFKIVSANQKRRLSYPGN